MTLGELSLQFSSDSDEYIVTYSDRSVSVEGRGETIGEALFDLSFEVGMNSVIDNDPFAYDE